mmetsp:Transcript_72632/g.228814  ORF Transcript_72632/g.228814 Transcript_72632/m.228814 type:complete len:338 (-) Transcript_72632:547-1560(-)
MLLAAAGGISTCSERPVVKKDAARTAAAGSASSLRLDTEYPWMLTWLGDTGKGLPGRPAPGRMRKMKYFPRVGLPSSWLHELSPSSRRTTATGVHPSPAPPARQVSSSRARSSSSSPIASKRAKSLSLGSDGHTRTSARSSPEAGAWIVTLERQKLPRVWSPMQSVVPTSGGSSWRGEHGAVGRATPPAPWSSTADTWRIPARGSYWCTTTRPTPSLPASALEPVAAAALSSTTALDSSSPSPVATPPPASGSPAPWRDAPPVDEGASNAIKYMKRPSEIAGVGTSGRPCGAAKCAHRELSAPATEPRPSCATLPTARRVAQSMTRKHAGEMRRLRK